MNLDRYFYVNISKMEKVEIFIEKPAGFISNNYS